MPTAFLRNRTKIPVLSFIVFLFCSCSNSANTPDELMQLEQGLTNSIQVINMSTQLILHDLEEKTINPVTMERSAVWLPKAEKVTGLSEEFCQYIDRIKKNPETGKAAIDIANKKLQHYKEGILNIDSSIGLEFRNVLASIPMIKGKNKTSLLTKLKNDIKIVENKIVAYCNSRTTETILICEFPQMMIGQNSNYLQPGSELILTAGIGSYRTMKNQSVTINGRTIPVNDEGYVVHKIKVSTVPGIYKTPVKITFLDESTGKESTQETNIEYTVAKECDQ